MAWCAEYLVATSVLYSCIPFWALFWFVSNLTESIKPYMQTVKCGDIGKKGFLCPRFSIFILKWFCQHMLKANKQKLLSMLRTSPVHNLYYTPQCHWHKMQYHWDIITKLVVKVEVTLYLLISQTRVHLVNIPFFFHYWKKPELPQNWFFDDITMILYTYLPRYLTLQLRVYMSFSSQHLQSP